MSPLDSNLRMTALERASSNCKLQTHPVVREDVTRTMTTIVQSKKRVAGRETPWACQDELIDGKPPIVK
jgi:hypothetical protein